MEVSGQRVDRCVLEPGDSLLLKGQMLLFFTRRPRKLPALRSASLNGAPGFGMPDPHGIVGEGPVAWRLRDQLAWIAGADEHTLLLGGSGSGKQLCARAVHALSARGKGAFVVQNAATIPSGLVDASGGTLFLDEIGEVSQSSQANLLRALDEGGEHNHFGGSPAKRPSFRLLGATNREPEALKNDLASRLVLRLHVPGLDERRDDIPLLVRHLLRRALQKSPDALRRFCSSEGGGEPMVRASVIEALMKHHYTSNIRELDGLLWRAISSSPGDVIAWPDEPAPKGTSVSPFRKDESSPGGSRPSDTPDPTETEVRAALAEHKGNIARTSHALGLSSRYVLYRLMRRYGIEGVREEP